VSIFRTYIIIVFRCQLEEEGIHINVFFSQYAF